jgi:hypothetical protein
MWPHIYTLAELNERSESDTLSDNEKLRQHTGDSNIKSSLIFLKLIYLHLAGFHHILRHRFVPPWRGLSLVQVVEQLQQHSHKLFTGVHWEVLGRAIRRGVAVGCK